MMKTIAGHVGAEAVAELVHRLHDADPKVDGIELEVGHTNGGTKIIALTDRGYTVLLTVEQAESVLHALQRMVLAIPDTHTWQVAIVGQALSIALADGPPPFATVH